MQYRRARNHAHIHKYAHMTQYIYLHIFTSDHEPSYCTCRCLRASPQAVNTYTVQETAARVVGRLANVGDERAGMHPCMHISKFLYLYVSIYVCVYVYIYVYIYTYIGISMYVYVCVYIKMRINVYACTCV